MNSHDWPDADCISILKNTALAMGHMVRNIFAPVCMSGSFEVLWWLVKNSYHWSNFHSVNCLYEHTHQLRYYHFGWPPCCWGVQIYHATKVHTVKLWCQFQDVSSTRDPHDGGIQCQRAIFCEFSFQLITMYFWCRLWCFTVRMAGNHCQFWFENLSSILPACKCFYNRMRAGLNSYLGCLFLASRVSRSYVL